MEHDAQQPGDHVPGPASGPPGSGDGSPLAPPPAYAGPPAQMSEADARTFAMLAHLSSFSGMVMPFGHILGPLLVWLLKREHHPLVDDQGKEALNFQLSMSLYYIVGVILVVVLIGILILIGLFVFSVVVTIMAAVKANSGERYRYPLAIRFVK